MRYILLVSLCVMAHVCLAQTTRPTSGPTSSPGDSASVAQCIRDIHAAAKPDQAATAYARGCTIDRLEPAVHHAYMVRLLQLKQPQLADAAAKLLTKIDATDVLAWQVVAYNAGKRGDWSSAAKAMIHAASINSSDPVIAANMGQLAAWFDSQDKPPCQLTDSEKDSLEQLRKKLADSSDFQQANDRADTSFKDYKDKLAEIARKLESAQAALKNAQDSGSRLELMRDSAENNAARIRLSISNLQDRAKNSADPSRYQQSIQIRQNDLARANRVTDDYKRRIQQAKTEYDQKKKTADDLTKQASAPPDLAKIFQWQPPDTSDQAATQPSDTK